MSISRVRLLVDNDDVVVLFDSPRTDDSVYVERGVTAFCPDPMKPHLIICRSHYTAFGCVLSSIRSDDR